MRFQPNNMLHPVSTRPPRAYFISHLVVQECDRIYCSEKYDPIVCRFVALRSASPENPAHATNPCFESKITPNAHFRCALVSHTALAFCSEPLRSILSACSSFIPFHRDFEYASHLRRLHPYIPCMMLPCTLHVPNVPMPPMGPASLCPKSPK